MTQEFGFTFSAYDFEGLQDPNDSLLTPGNYLKRAGKSMDRLIETGAKTIIIEAITTQELATSNDVASSYSMLKPKQFVKVVELAKDKGLKVWIKSDNGVLDESIGDAPTPTDPAVWFQNYTNHLVKYAKIANRLGVDSFLLTNELKTMTTVPEYRGYWIDAIAKVRAVYDGPVGLNLQSIKEGPESSWESSNLAIGDLVDFIGLSCYTRLYTTTDPTSEDIRNGWFNNINDINLIEYLDQFIANHDVPIFLTELGFPNLSGGNYRFFNLTAKEWKNYLSYLDEAEQALAYRTTFEVLQQELGDNLAGFFPYMWQAQLVSEKFGWLDSNIRWGIAFREAEDEISDWFLGKREIVGLEVEDTSKSDLILTGNGADTILLGIGSDRVLSAGGDDIVHLQGGADVAKSALFTLGNVEGLTDEIKMTVFIDGEVIVKNVFKNDFSKATGSLPGASFGELKIKIELGEGKTALNLYSLELNGIDVNLSNAVIDRGWMVENYSDYAERYFGSFADEVSLIVIHDAIITVDISKGGFFDWVTKDDDEISTGAGNDILRGSLNGADVFDGGEGIDRLELPDSVFSYDFRGGGGKLSLANDSGSVSLKNVEHVVFSEDLFVIGGGGRQIIDLPGGDYIGALGGGGADNLAGNGRKNFLFGGNGNDNLEGGKGNDNLEGGKGNDNLEGGIGKDQFVFASKSGDDVILDFDQKDGDKINLKAVVGITSFSDLTKNHLSQQGDDASISFGRNSVTVLDTLISDLDRSDFLL